MTSTAVPIRHDDRFFIGGKWVEPSSADFIEVIDSSTEELYFRVPRRGRPTWPGPSTPPARRSTEGRGRG